MEEIIEEVVIIEDHTVADDAAARQSVDEYHEAIATNDPNAPTGEEPVTDLDGNEVSQVDMPASGVWPGQPADALSPEAQAATPDDVTEGVQGGPQEPQPPAEPEPAATEPDPLAGQEPGAGPEIPAAGQPGVEPPAPPETPQPPAEPGQ